MFFYNCFGYYSLDDYRKIISVHKAKLFAEILRCSPEQFIALAFQDYLERARTYTQVEIRDT